MKAINLYISLDDFDAYIKSKLSAKDLAEFQDCTWVPLDLKLNAQTDMSIDALIVPVKNGEVEKRDKHVQTSRIRISETNID